MANELDKSIIEDVQSMDGMDQQESDSVVTPEQQTAINEEIEKEEKYGDSSILAGALGAARGLSFGASDYIAKESGLLSSEDLREIDERNSAASTIGEIGGVIGGTLLSGGTSAAAKAGSLGISAAAKAGLATEHLASKALQKLIASEGKKKVAKDILSKGIAKSAGLTVEGTFYSTGHLISEQALGRADFNAENFISGVKDAAVFGSILGVGSATFSAVVPVMKNNKVVGWVSEKFKGKAPTNINESAGFALGKSNKELAKLKKHSPKEYENLGKYTIEDLKFKMSDSPTKLMNKNELVIKNATEELDSLFPELDTILKQGDELGMPFEGSTNAQMSENLVRDLNNWIEDTLTMRNPNGQVVRRPGVSESELRGAVEEVEKIRSIFGVSATEKTMEKVRNIKAINNDKVNALNVRKYKLKENMRQAELYKDVPKLRKRQETLKTSKKSNIAKVKTRVLEIDKKILELKQSLTTADSVLKLKIKQKIQTLKNNKESSRLKLREVNDKLDQELTSLNVKIKKAPKVKEPEFFSKQLKSIDDEISSINSKFKNDTAPLQKEILDFNTSAYKSVDASKIRRMRQDWSAKAEWHKRYPELSSRAKMARSGYEMLNNKIASLAEMVEGVNSTISTKILNANLKVSTGLKIHNTLETASLKTLGIKEGAGKFLLGMAAKSTGLGGPIGFIMQSRGTYDILRGLGEANLIHKMKLLSSIEKSNQAAQRTVNKSISGFFKDKAIPKAKPIVMDSILKSDLALKINDEDLTVKKPKSRQEAFKNVTFNISDLLTNDSKLMEQASQVYPEFEEAAPETRQMISNNLISMVQYLDSVIPKNSTLSTPGLVKRDWEPSSLELAKFERTLKAVQNPLSILEDLENGIITREGADALRILKPQLFKQVQNKVMNEIATAKETIPYQKRLLLGILLDIESDAALNGLNIAALQSLHNEAEESQAGGSTAFRSDKVKADKLNMSESTQSGVESISKRKQS